MYIEFTSMDSGKTLKFNTYYRLRGTKPKGGYLVLKIDAFLQHPTLKKHGRKNETLKANPCLQKTNIYKCFYEEFIT